MSVSEEFYERMAAYLDGEMDEGQRNAFERECEADPTLAAELARFAQNDALLHEAFDAPMDEPVDAALLERMGLAEPKPGRAAANDDTPGWNRWGWPAGGLVAASLALAVLFTGPSGMTPFERALDQTPSGQLASLEEGVSLQPVLSFQAADGRYCREYVLAEGNASESGIACRADGAWQVEFAGGDGTILANPDRIEVASGADDASLDEVYARLGAGDPLGADAENNLISKGWVK